MGHSVLHRQFLTWSVFLSLFHRGPSPHCRPFTRLEIHGPLHLDGLMNKVARYSQTLEVCVCVCVCGWSLKSVLTRDVDSASRGAKD
jgi:hypothetical protein